MGRKGYVRRERKDWEVAMGVIKGRGGEKYGEIMQQYSIFRNRNKGLEEGSHEKRYGSWQVWTPYPQSSIRHDYDLRILR